MELDVELGPSLHAYTVLDVFTDTPLEGNQLAVFSDGSRFDELAMQRIARELNLSETVFVLAPEQGGDARIRIFTPASELPFAGHPTLGSAALVALASGRERVELETGSGIVPVAIERTNGLAAFGRMLGIDEDPATGGAAGPLAVHLARHGLAGYGQELEIHQGAEVGRPSLLYARACGSGDQIERVEVAGWAVIVAKGTFRL